MLSIALGTLRTRAGGFVGAFVAMFCAAALLSGCGLLLQTGIRGQVSSQRYAAAPLVVAAGQQLRFTEHKHGKTKIKSKAATETVHLPPAETGRVREVSGVESAIPEVAFPATVIGSAGADPSWGHGWGSARLTPFTLKAGHRPSSPHEVVVDAASGARVGDRVWIQTPESVSRYTVSGVTAQALPGQRAVFFTDATAGRLAGHRLTAIGIWPAAGTNRATLLRALEATGPDVLVYSGDAKGSVEFRDAARARIGLISTSAVIGGTALLVAILVVVGTLALSIEQRQRETALLRAVGATPRQVRRLISRETLMLGVLAAGLGAAAGLPLGHWLHGRFVAYGAIPARLDLVVGPLPMVAAGLATLGAGWVGARVAARHATRGSAAAALSGATSHRRWIGALAGLLLLIAGGAVTGLLTTLHTAPAAMPVSILAVVVLAAGLMLLGPLIGQVAAAVTGVVLRGLSRVAGYLAAENLHANPRRLAAVVGPLTLAVAMATVVLFTGTTLAGAAHRQAQDGTIAAYALRSSGAGVPAGVVRVARDTADVTAVTQVMHSTVWLGKKHYPAQGVTPTRLDATMDLGVVAGDIGHLSEHTVALGSTTADGLGKQVGDTLRLRLGDGTPVSLRVVAIYTRGIGFGPITLPYDVLAGHVDIPMASSVLIAAPASAHDALQALATKSAGITLRSHAATSAGDGGAGNAAVRYIALGLVLAFTAISVVNTLAIATTERRRELELLGMLGATRRQILRMLRAETLAALCIGLLLGAALGGAILAAFAAGVTGSPTPTISTLGCAATVAITALLAYLGTAIPARAVLRTRRPT